MCRYGGEEFVVVFPTADTESAARRADVLRHAVERSPMLLQTGSHVSVTISVGVASFPIHVDTAQALCHCADEAL